MSFAAHVAVLSRVMLRKCWGWCTRVHALLGVVFVVMDLFQPVLLFLSPPPSLPSFLPLGLFLLDVMFLLCLSYVDS